VIYGAKIVFLGAVSRFPLQSFTASFLSCKRIFTAIGAMLPQAFFCLEAKETKIQGPQIN